MGTNYYWVGEPCPTCAHSATRLHIGKSSSGWCFSLHVEQSEKLFTLDDWLERIESSGQIQNEYGEFITKEALLKTITERTNRPFDGREWAKMGYRDEPDFHAKNHSERGPNGLLRHAIDGRHCIGHGEGTWDYIVGEFS